MTQIVKHETLFEVKDIFGTTIRTSKPYWESIKNIKHQDLQFTTKEVIATLQKPDQVYLSVKDEFILLFYKTYPTTTLVVVVKYLNQRGFIITVYKTSKTKHKGKQLWPKSKST